MTDNSPRRTPLYDAHVAAGAKIVDFAGWEMPVQYSGLIEEHRAVREAAGLFDVSHMGELRVTGADAETFLQELTPNDVTRLEAGQAHYSALLNHEGTYVDDLLVYRMADDDFLVVVNAANVDGDFEHVKSRADAFDGDVTAENHSDRWALLALQGPRAVEILQQLTETDLSEIRYYRFAEGRVDGRSAILSRTGYTGEDGFELYVAPEDAPAIWDRLLDVGEEHGLIPAGLGARDTLRLEAAMALYGHEIDHTTNPYEARLGWTVKLGTGDFVGRDAVVAAKEAGPERKLVGFEVTDRGIAREGSIVYHGDDEVGRVTSGTWSPTFEKALGLAYVPVALAEPGTEVEIGVRKRRLAARVVETPFYKRSR